MTCVKAYDSVHEWNKRPNFTRSGKLNDQEALQCNKDSNEKEIFENIFVYEYNLEKEHI